MKNDDKTYEQKVESSDIAALMKLDSFKRVMYSILEHTGCERSTYAKDAFEHAYRAGKRDVGLHIRNKLRKEDQINFDRMIKENET